MCGLYKGVSGDTVKMRKWLLPSPTWLRHACMAVLLCRPLKAALWATINGGKKVTMRRQPPHAVHAAATFSPLIFLIHQYYMLKVLYGFTVMPL